MPKRVPSFTEGQRVWYKGRLAIFRYYMGDGAAVVRFDGGSETSVVSMALLSSSPPPPDAEAA
jgi:hypothetical protein